MSLKWEDEKRYTLAEADVELRRKECHDHGHSWDAISVMGMECPVSICCSNCGQTHHVLQPEQVFVDQVDLDRVIAKDAVQESAYGVGVRDTLKHLKLWAR